MVDFECSVLLEAERQEEKQEIKNATREATIEALVKKKTRREKIQGQEVDRLAEKLSSKIDRIRTENNRVSFSLAGEDLTFIQELSKIEDVSISKVCRDLLIEYLNEKL